MKKIENRAEAPGAVAEGGGDDAGRISAGTPLKAVQGLLQRSKQALPRTRGDAAAGPKNPRHQKQGGESICMPSFHFRLFVLPIIGMLPF